jgi:membrane protein DedA with SNARE-associated domain
MESFISEWGLAAVFLFGFLEAACVPIPSEITFGFAGVLAFQGHFNIILVIVIGTLGELIGSFLSYAVGRVGGRPLVERFGRYLLITSSDLDRAERFFAGRGAFAVPLGRALPIVRTFISLAAGFVEMPALLFGVLSLIGTAIWVTAISLVGYELGSVWQSVAHGIALAGYVLAALIVLAVVAFIAHRLREVRKETAARLAAPAGLAATAGPEGPVAPGSPVTPEVTVTPEGTATPEVTGAVGTAGTGPKPPGHRKARGRTS